ncbi:MAG: molybdopterin-dependent oxidoreductase, partial [Streptosporangiaceae bacterium]
MAESDAAPLRRVTTTADEATPIHCPYCATQRGSALADGPGEIATVNAVLSSPAQLTTPLRRAHLGAPLEPCTWEEALDTIAAEIMKLRAAHGPDAVAVFGGNGLGREELRSRTSQADGNGRFCTSSAAAALNRAFGRDRGLPGPLTDVSAADVIFMVGGNPAGTMPPFAQHLADQRAAGGARIVADPRRTTAARQSDLHLQLTPGTDLALANGMLHLAVTEGLLDEAYIRARTSGFDAVRTKVGAYWPERVERITGVPLPKIREAVRMLGA